MSHSFSLSQALRMDLYSDPLTWGDSEAPFAAGMAQYPLISEDHYKPSDQDPAALTVLGASGGDLNSIYQTPRHQYESGAKDLDRQLYTNCMKSPLSTIYEIENDECRAAVLGCTSPSVTVTSTQRQHDDIDHPQQFHDLHVQPSHMIAAAQEDVTPPVTSLACRSPVHAPGVQMDQIHEGSDAIKVGSSSSFNEMDHMLLSADGSPAAQTAITTHPLYPYLVSAHINCCKIGAEAADVKSLGEILSKHLQPQNNCRPSAATKPELDNVMAWYIRMLIDLKEAMEEPFFREMEWCNEVFEKLKLLGPSSSPIEMTDWAVEGQTRTGDKAEEYASVAGETRLQSHAPSFDRQNGMTMERSREDKIVKDWLKSKHDRSEIYNLRGQCSKKRRQGKHPETARECLVDWFNGHGEWPYPSEEEKQKLAEETKLEARQINNWFINQRKRHWDSPTKEEAIQQVEQELKSHRQFANVEKVFIDRFYVPVDMLKPSSYSWSSNLT